MKCSTKVWFASGISHFLDSTRFLLERTSDRQKVIIQNWLLTEIYSKMDEVSCSKNMIVFIANSKILASKWKFKICICYHELIILLIKIFLKDQDRIATMNWYFPNEQSLMIQNYTWEKDTKGGIYEWILMLHYTVTLYENLIDMGSDLTL